MFACITYIPEISHQLKRAFKTAGINTTFTSAPKLKDLLCSKNTTKPPQEKRKGIYKYKCPCTDNATYVGQTGCSFEIQWDKHKKAIDRQQWSHSGVTQHYQHCPHQFSKDNFDIVHKMQGKKKGALVMKCAYVKQLKYGKTNVVLGAALTKIWAPTSKLIYGILC